MPDAIVLPLNEAVASALTGVLVGLFMLCLFLVNRAKPARRVVVAAAATDLDVEPPTPQEVETMKGAVKINVDVDACPRCGGNHEDLEFSRFHSNPIGSFTHFGVCPKSVAPVLIRVGVVADNESPKAVAACGLKEPAGPADAAPPAVGGCSRRGG